MSREVSAVDRPRIGPSSERENHVSAAEKAEAADRDALAVLL
jgi:hypothetical protein